MTYVLEIIKALLAHMPKESLKEFESVERKLTWGNRRGYIGWIATLSSPIWISAIVYGAIQAYNHITEKRQYKDPYFQTAEAKDSFCYLLDDINARMDKEKYYTGITIASVQELLDYAYKTFTPENKITVADVSTARQNFEDITQILDRSQKIEGCSTLVDLITTLGATTLFKTHEADSTATSYDPSKRINPRAHRTLERTIADYNARQKHSC